MKDYYAILEVPLTATVPEIKQAYRKLAMIYHPDKNHPDPYAFAKFNEMKEAYETLMNPAKKELYLQERWLHKASGKPINEGIITAPVILIQSLKLNKSIAAMDVYRMDHASIAAKINQILTDEVIEKLLTFQETETNQAILIILLKATSVLPFTETKKVTDQLRKLAIHQPTILRQIDETLQQKKQAAYLHKFNGLFMFILTLLLCFVIYIMSQ